MTYQELLANIRDLGFSDDAEMSEFGDLVINSINRAISEINVGFAHIKKKYEFELDDNDTGFVYIAMPSIDGQYLSLVDHPITYEVNGAGVYTNFTDYYIEMDDTIVINADKNKGKFRIFYNAAHKTYTGESMNSTQLPLPLRAHHLVPLLASYYIWLEDEPVKAAQYYNLFEQQRSTYVLNAEKPKMRVLEGGI